MWSSLLILFASVVHAATVPDEYGSIQEAIDHAPPGAVITVAPGIYYESLEIMRDVVIQGEDAGDPPLLRHASADEPLVGIAEGVEAELRYFALDGEGVVQGVYVSSSSTFRFENSSCTQAVAESGGCIVAYGPGTQVTLFQSQFSFNEATEFGGHVAVSDADLRVEESRFYRGTASVEGGAIYAALSTLDMRDSRFEQNLAGHWGGAVLSHSGTVASLDSWFLYNEGAFGGGLGALHGEVVMEGGAFIGNVVHGDGGGLINFDSQLLLNRVAMVGNEALNSGGGLFTEGYAGIELHNGWLVSNVAGNGGGALTLAMNGSHQDLFDMMVRQNEARAGGGLYQPNSANGFVTIRRSHFCGNRAVDYDGGAIYFYGGFGGMLDLHNSTLIRNYAAGYGGGIYFAAYDLYSRNNLFIENETGYDGAMVYAGWLDGYASSYRNLYAWAVGGYAYMDPYGGAFLEDDNWFENPHGDAIGYQFMMGTYEDPGLMDFSPGTAGCDDFDLRPTGAPGVDHIGPWASGAAPRWYDDLDGDGEIGLTDCDDFDPLRNSSTVWYLDEDGDGVGGTSGAIHTGCFPLGMNWVLKDGDCDDTNPEVQDYVMMYDDQDGDGFGDPSTATLICGVHPPPGMVLNGDDCDDSDPSLHPETQWYVDADGDGFGDSGATAVVSCARLPGHVLNNLDCDDTDPDIHPNTLWFQDLDEDGYGNPDEPWGPGCLPPAGYVLDSSDCDDLDDEVHPGATEVCDGVDNNCDGFIDLHAVDAGLWAPDLDGDGFGDDSQAMAICDPDPGWVQIFGDCDDTNADVYPGAPERCDGLDNDCNGAIDDNPIDEETWYLDEDGDGWGDSEKASVMACDPPDGYGPPGDCDDANPAVNPAAVEVCSGIDDDCNGLVDDEDPGLDLDSAPIWYLDADGDGLGDGDEGLRACEAPQGYVANSDDCDDSDPLVGVCLTPSDVDPPSNGKAGNEPPDGPSRYGFACQHGKGDLLSIWALGLGLGLALSRRRLGGAIPRA